MAILLAILGVVLFSLGFAISHRTDKSSRLLKRVGGVLVGMAGIAAIWYAAALSIPILVHEKIRIVSVSENVLVAKVSFNLVRECKTSNFKAFLVKEGVKVQTDAAYMVPDLDIEDVGFTIVINNNHMQNPDHFIVQFMHRCPLGIDVISEFPPQPMPDKFNQKELH
jgi:hypothetical protein